MSQDLIDLVARIESAPPEYIAFRKEVLGDLWNDYENAYLLGPFELNRSSDEDAQIAQCVFGESEEGNFLLYNADTEEFIWEKLPAGPWRDEFDQYLDSYAECIGQLPGQLKVLYKDVIGEIKGYLANQYAGIAPKRSHFTEWLISQVPTPLIYITGTRDSIKKTRWHKTFGLRGSTFVLTAESVERSLHEYCHWKKTQQDKLYVEVTRPSTHETPANLTELTDDQKLDIVINEFKNRSVENNPINGVPMDVVVNFFIQLTIGNDGNPYLTKAQFVDFLKRAFDNQSSLAKINANYTEGINKSDVINLFYCFYIGAKGKYCKGRYVKDKHLRLLTDNFQGFDFHSIHPNFSHYEAKPKWNKLSEYC